MITLLLTVMQALLLSYLVKDKDVKYTLIAMAGVFFINILMYGYPLYYIRHAGLDILFCLSGYFLKDLYKRVILFGICLSSYAMNLYEHFSYYQTIIYPYRKEIQWCLVQMMYLTVLHNCKWRDLCKKTHTRK